jgi:hypothetical protein
MDEKSEKLTTPTGAVVDLVLTIAVFIFFSIVIRPHVPAQTEFYVIFFSLYTAFCLAGVFWMAISMFRVVRVDYSRRSRE